MPIQLFPLIPKAAGFLQDGSLYQGDYCTNGQWVRFYQGKPKKMGGLLAISNFVKESLPPQGCKFITSIWLGGIITYLAINKTGIFSNTVRVESPTQFTRDWKQEVTFPINPQKYNSFLWQSQIVLSTVKSSDGKLQSAPQTSIVLFGCANLNINNTTPADFYKVTFDNNEIKTIDKFDVARPDETDPTLNGAKNDLNGGIVYVNSLLFIYGTEGVVIWSSRQNPFSFDANSGSSSGMYNISNDKVIYGASVRGGQYQPTLLFWTMNSVVRLSNQSSDSKIDAVPEFQVDVITQESSILSSRSVVEYDGIFFWLGIDRIFLYNGVVREVVNNTNFDWFFKTLDVTRRQLVFGIKNSEKGEIWWYFPVENVEGCSAALIYNIRENIWYNTNIPRDCGFFDGASGKMITYGQNLAFLRDNTSSYIWIHETGHRQVSANGIKTGIFSYYTTPLFSLTAFSPFGQGGGQNNALWIDRIEPDFKLDTGEVMEMTVNAKEYADQTPITVFEGDIIGGAGKVDIRAQGRNVSFTFKTTADFSHGYPLVGVKVGDGR